MPKAAKRWHRSLTLGSILLAAVAGVAAATPASAQPDASVGQSSVVHVVRPGEWLSSIARNYGVDTLAIAALNHLRPPYVLHPGDKIIVPARPMTRAVSNPVVPPGQPAPSAQSANLTPQTTTNPPPPTAARPAAPPASATAVVQTAPAAPRPNFPTVTTGQTPPSPRSASRPSRTVTVELPLKDRANYLGDIDVTITPDGALSFNTAQAIELLSKSLSAEALASLKTVLAGETTAPLSDFGKAAIVAVYDPTQLQIVLTIPGHSRPTNAMDVADLDQAGHGKLVAPEGLSGYLNFRGSVDAVEAGAQKGLDDPLIDMDGALRFGKWVLTGEASIGPNDTTSLTGTTNTEESFTRQGTRLIYDDLKNTLRWTIGDLQPETTGFQGGVDISGVSVVRLYNELEPQLDVRPRGERSFTLERASTVETTINGRLVQTVRLDPGTYDLHNFPFVDGANDVQIVIQDDSGQRETLTFSIFFDRTLLAPGLMEFGAWAGVETYSVNGDLRYAVNDPIFSGFIRRGMSDRLTLGANLQASKTTQVLGGQFIWGSPLGTLGGDLAYSHDTTAGSGYAINIGLSRLFQSADSFKSQSLSASFEAKSVNFTQLTATSATPLTLGGTTVPGSTTTAANAALNPYSSEFALTYGRSFSEYIYANLDARYSLGRAGQADVGSVTATLGWRPNNVTSLTFDADYEESSTERGPGFRISITRRLGRTRNIRADYDSLGNQATLSYQDSHGRGVGSSSVGADLTYASNALGLDATVNYQANRADLGITQTSSWDFGGTSVQDQRTSFQFGTSIAFAGNAVAIGRPIYDSFAILEPHPSLKGAQVVVDPSQDGRLAESGLLGGAVLSDLGSYSVRTIIYDVPNAPAGYDIGQGSILVKPPYRSGYKVVVGSDYSVTVIGRLLDADGAPISLLAGHAYDLDDPKHEPVEMFTSRDGRFGAQGLRPGHWRIEMPTQPVAKFIITVPKGATGLYRAGDLKPSGS
ncbi:MAG TPA: LysM peptidoglycan-binding domain-containing protein [Caulobacteraceae bacterium]|jgi:outer membrane usher protein|nr:LysM peptidoglycan-binding domain-containing protein [Caulobacteraceae bacterium]